MYYGDSNDPYYNIHLKYHFEENLPMDEFAKGNFSQAHKIIETYKEYIKNCMKSSTRQNTGGEEKISTYLKKQLSILEIEHKERTEKKAQAIQDMENTEKKINDEKQALKDEGKGDNTRNIFFNFREKNNYDIEMLEKAFENTKNDKPKKYEETKEMFGNFLTLACEIDYTKLAELEREHFETKKKRNEANHTLSHKSNRMNLEKQIDDIKTGRKSTGIKDEISKDVFETFKKMDHMGHIIDNRSLQEMFTSIMATELILDYKTDKQVKIDLIRNHTDKLGLFDHVRRIYKNTSGMFLEIETGRSNRKEYRNELMKDRIGFITKTSREILDKIPAISGYFRVDKKSPEEIEIWKNTGGKDRKKTVIDDLVSHLEEILDTPEKKEHWRQQPDSKISKLFDGIYSMTESHEFENYCEKLRSIDENSYWNIIGTEGKMLLREVYSSMDQEERKTISSDYQTRGLFEQIEKDILDKEIHEQENQLLLYDFAPIYNIKGYIEKATEHINSQIKDISYQQSRTLEGVIYQMFKDQGYESHIDSGTPIQFFSDEEFINIVKTSRGGKSLSSILKKANVKLLPDINERIAEMKKTVKGDIM